MSIAGDSSSAARRAMLARIEAIEHAIAQFGGKDERIDRIDCAVKKLRDELGEHKEQYDIDQGTTRKEIRRTNERVLTVENGRRRDKANLRAFWERLNYIEAVALTTWSALRSLSSFCRKALKFLGFRREDPPPLPGHDAFLEALGKARGGPFDRPVDDSTTAMKIQWTDEMSEARRQREQTKNAALNEDGKRGGGGSKWLISQTKEARHGTPRASRAQIPRCVA